MRKSRFTDSQIMAVLKQADLAQFQWTLDYATIWASNASGLMYPRAE